MNKPIQVKIHLRPHLAQYLRYLNKSDKHQSINLSNACSANLHISSLFVHRNRFLSYKKEIDNFADGREVVVLEVRRQYIMSRRARQFIPQHSQKIIEQYLNQLMLELLYTNTMMWRENSRMMKVAENGQIKRAYLSQDCIIRSSLEIIGIDANMVDYENVRRQLNRYKKIGVDGRRQFALTFEIPEGDSLQFDLFDKIRKTA